MEQWPPIAEEIIELPVDELAMRMLRNLLRHPGSKISRSSCTHPDFYRSHGTDYDSFPVQCSMGEAFDWLLFNGLIAEQPNQPDGWLYVTKRGTSLGANPQGMETLKASSRINVEMHPSIATKVRRQFMLPEYDTAVLLAFKAVEIRVRSLAGYDNSQFGVPMMRNAFNPVSGPLSDQTLIEAERKATADLFAGAFGLLKNPASHRQVDYNDVTEASEAVLLADLLMRILDRCESSTKP